MSIGDVVLRELNPKHDQYMVNKSFEGSEDSQFLSRIYTIPKHVSRGTVYGAAVGGLIGLFSDNPSNGLAYGVAIGSSLDQVNLLARMYKPFMKSVFSSEKLEE